MPEQMEKIGREMRGAAKEMDRMTESSAPKVKASGGAMSMLVASLQALATAMGGQLQIDGPTDPALGQALAAIAEAVQAAVKAGRVDSSMEFDPNIKSDDDAETVAAKLDMLAADNTFKDWLVSEAAKPEPTKPKAEAKPKPTEPKQQDDLMRSRMQ